ncbi:MAG: twin-arginine translocase subunit TatC, partial [Pirellulaceae bacterium]
DYALETGRLEGKASGLSEEQLEKRLAKQLLPDSIHIDAQALWRDLKKAAPDAFKQRRISLYTDQDRKQAAEIEVKAKAVEAERTKKQEVYIEQTFQRELAKLPEALRQPIIEARKVAVDKQTDEQKQLLKDNPTVNVTAGSLYLYDKKAADDLATFVKKAKEVRDTKPVEQFLRAAWEQSGDLPDELQTLEVQTWKTVDASVKTLNAHEAFMIWMKAGFIFGFVLSSPVVFYYIWSFIAAGLYPHEKKIHPHLSALQPIAVPRGFGTSVPVRFRTGTFFLV